MVFELRLYSAFMQCIGRVGKIILERLEMLRGNRLIWHEQPQERHDNRHVRFTSSLAILDKLTLSFPSRQFGAIEWSASAT